jgi:uncharacterized protein
MSNLSTMSRAQDSPPLDPATLGDDGCILEGVVTTLNADGSSHLAPMGPIVTEAMDWLWLRPFQTSTTFQNLNRSRCGVFHVTDDVELLAHAAVGEVDPLPKIKPAEQIEGAILTDACRWYAFEILSIDASTERTNMAARVVDRGVHREFFGFNRAKHAVVEAAILATRLHLLDAQQIRNEFDRLAIAVQKTGSAAEHRAFAFLRDYVERAMPQGGGQ